MIDLQVQLDLALESVQNYKGYLERIRAVVGDGCPANIIDGVAYLKAECDEARQEAKDAAMLARERITRLEASCTRLEDECDEARQEAKDAAMLARERLERITALTERGTRLETEQSASESFQRQVVEALGGSWPTPPVATLDALAYQLADRRRLGEQVQKLGEQVQKMRHEMDAVAGHLGFSETDLGQILGSIDRMMEAHHAAPARILELEEQVRATASWEKDFKVIADMMRMIGHDPQAVIQAVADLIRRLVEITGERATDLADVQARLDVAKIELGAAKIELEAAKNMDGYREKLQNANAGFVSALREIGFALGMEGAPTTQMLAEIRRMRREKDLPF